MFTSEFKAKLIAADILNLAEIMVFFASLAKKRDEAREDDGVVSRLESLKMTVELLGELWDALVGMKELPREFSDIPPEEVELLGDAIAPYIEHLPSQRKDQVFALVGFIREASNLARTFTRPPKAHPVP